MAFDPHPSTCTILVVDDERELRLFAEAVLQDLGYSVLLADSGRVAVQKLLNNPSAITAVLLDMTMPGITPEQTVRHLREICPALPVIILSGESETFVNERFDAGSLAGYLSKPYTEEDLKAVLTNALFRGVLQSSSTFKLEILSDLDRQELAHDFLAARKKDFPRMAELLAAAEFDQLRILSHKLKGGGGSFGFPHLTRLGGVLEHYAQRSDAASCGEQLALLEIYLRSLSLNDLYSK